MGFAEKLQYDLYREDPRKIKGIKLAEYGRKSLKAGDLIQCGSHYLVVLTVNDDANAVTCADCIVAPIDKDVTL